MLKAFASIFVLVGLLHIGLGLGADALLGANPSPDALANPSLNSQNRFYGAEFMAYGVLIWMFAGDRERYGPVFQVLMIVFFIGGLTRILSVIVHGWPAPAIVFLAATELLFPPALLWWQSRA